MRFLIWSQKHSQWWGPDRCGYTPHTANAGRYTENGAAEVVLHSFPPGANIAVDETQADTFLRMREGNDGKVVTYL